MSEKLNALELNDEHMDFRCALGILETEFDGSPQGRGPLLPFHFARVHLLFRKIMLK